MTFGDEYIKHLSVLENVGMTRIDPIKYQGQQIAPIEFLKALLPDPEPRRRLHRQDLHRRAGSEASKDGKAKLHFVYNICDHAECYRKCRRRACSYTTGVPAMIGAMLMLSRAPG